MEQQKSEQPELWCSGESNSDGLGELETAPWKGRERLSLELGGYLGLGGQDTGVGGAEKARQALEQE